MPGFAAVCLLTCVDSLFSWHSVSKSAYVLGHYSMVYKGKKLNKICSASLIGYLGS